MSVGDVPALRMAIMAAMENAKAEAEAQVRADPTNAQAHLQWGAALLELAQVRRSLAR